MPRKRSAFDESAKLNNRTYVDYTNRLKELAINVFQWENLPPSVDERFIELTLYELGYLVYFNDELLGNLALTCTIGGQLDVYRIPKFRQAYATNGYNRRLTNTDSVLIFNNYLHTPSHLTIELYAKRLYEIERAIDVNVKGQKTPRLIMCEESQLLTMKNVYMKYDGNQPVIYGDKNLGIDSIKGIDTTTPYVADKLMALKHQVWREALTFCGVESANQDKRERLVADEVSGNYGEVEAQRNIMLNARRQAVDKINAMFGTNINVRFRSDVKTTVNEPNVGEEENNEPVHNGSEMDS